MKPASLRCMNAQKRNTAMNKPQYVVQPSQKANHWVCTDVYNKVVIVWQDKKFNDTQVVTALDDHSLDPIFAARAMRNIGDYLVVHHSDKI